MTPEITITNETSKSVTINIEGDKVEQAVILKADLCEYVSEHGLNILEFVTPDCDIEQVELDPATYLNDNLLDVVKEYYYEN